MIFSLIITAMLFFLVLFPQPTIGVGDANEWNTEDTFKEEEIEAETWHVDADYDSYLARKETESPEVWNLVLDLDADGKNEEITIKSYPGFPGDQNTELYINHKTQPTLIETGYFDNMQTHRMDVVGRHILKLQLLTGQSLNTLFYTYQNGELNRVSVSTEKPPSWYGIVSRNDPELKDIDNDGVLELLAYYNFLYDSTRKVEVYRFTGSAFNKIKEYQEMMAEIYL